MASVRAIAAVTQAIAGVLSDARQTAAGLVPNHQNIAVVPMQAVAFNNPPGLTPGAPGAIGIYLYRLAPSQISRAVAPRTMPSGIRVRPPLPLDLFYLITAWAAQPPEQQRLLAWAMRTLEDTPILPPEVLNAAEPGTFRDDEAVELVIQGLNQTELVAVWEFNKGAMQAAVTYAARMINLDSNVALPEGPPAQTRGARVVGI